MYVKDMTEQEQYEILKMRKLSQDYYRQKGLGRPTKKDRPEMDGFISDDDVDFNDDDWDSFFSDDENQGEN